MKLADDVVPSGGAELHARPSNVLVVDDEPALRRYTARLLAEDGYTVLEAEDGAQALERIATAGDTLDVVVSDIVMPRLNGVQLLEKLHSVHPGLPVVLMSGYGTAQLTERGIAAPCAILTKPFPPEQLLLEVRRCLRGNR